MTRDTWDRADISTNLLNDPKFRAAWRLTGADPGRWSQGVVVYLATVLESWAAGRRVTAAEAAPIFLDDIEGTLAALVQAGLLDADGRIPEHAWESWFGPAERRRATGRERWQRWNEREKAKAEANASPTVSPALANGSPTPTIHPSVSPSNRPSAQGGAGPLPMNGRAPRQVTKACARCGGQVAKGDPGVVAFESGAVLEHAQCPAVVSS